MRKFSNPICFRRVVPKTRFITGMKWACGLLVVALLLNLGLARAEGPEDEFLQVYALIQEADSLETGGKESAALAKYREVHAALQAFQRNHSDWNRKIIANRLRDVGQKIATLSEKVTASSAAAAAGKEKQTGAQAAAASSSPRVKLLDAGAEPRQVLRLHPQTGDRQTLSLTRKMAVNTKAGEMQVMEMKLPSVKMTMDVTIKSVSADGDIAYELVMGGASVTEEPGAMPQVVAALKASLASAKGLSGTSILSNRGLSKGANVKTPAGAGPQNQEAVEQMTDILSYGAVPLPEEAVGAGARWEVKMPIKVQGMTIEQTSVYELVSREGERLKARSTIAQQAANQKIQNPAMPGAKIDLTKMVGKGTVDLVVDLAQVLPAEAAIDNQSELSMGVNMGGQKQAMSCKIDLKVFLQTK